MKKIRYILIFLMMFIFIGSVKANWSDPEKANCDGQTYYYPYYGSLGATSYRNTCASFASYSATEGARCVSQCGSGGTNGYCIRVSETCKYTLKDSSNTTKQVFCMEGNVALCTVSELPNASDPDSPCYNKTSADLVYNAVDSTVTNSGIACGLLDAYKALEDKSSGWSGNTFSLSSFSYSTIINMQKKIWAKQFTEATCDPDITYDTTGAGSLSLSAASGTDFTVQSIGNTDYYVSKVITASSTGRNSNGTITLTTAPSGSYFMSSTSTTTLGNVITISSNEVKFRIAVPVSTVQVGSNTIKVSAAANVFKRKKITVNASFTELTPVNRSQTGSYTNYVNQKLGYPKITRSIVNENQDLTDDITLNITGSTGKITIIKKDDKNAALAGAKFEISSDSNFSNPQVITIGSNGEGVKEGLSYGTYYIRESEAPAGFVKDSSVKTVTISAGSQANYEKSVTFTNTPIQIILNKVDFGTKKNLAGAKITVKTLKNGSVADLTSAGLTNSTWTSTAGTLTLKGIVAGDYYIYESEVPEGYEGGTYKVNNEDKPAVLHIQISAAGAITKTEYGTITNNKFTPYKINLPNHIDNMYKFFTVDETNHKITLYNYKLTEISKKDITGAKELEGAHILITNDADKDFKKEFVSKTEPTKMYLEKLEPGKYYYMTETAAPVGYETLVTVFKFTVDENGKPTLVSIGKWEDEAKTKYKEEKEVDSTDNFKTKDNTMTLLDEPIKIELYKKDSDTKKMIKGAHLVIKDENKKQTIKECDSQTSGPCELDLEPGTYYLIETKTPDGYEKNTSEYKIQVLESREVKLLSDKSKEISVSKNTITLYNIKVEVPDTGKSKNNIVLIMAIAGAVLVGLGLVIYILIRRKKTINSSI